MKWTNHRVALVGALAAWIVVPGAVWLLWTFWKVAAVIVITMIVYGFIRFELLEDSGSQ